MITVRVPLGDRSYDVLVGHGARHEMAGLLPRTAERAAIVTQQGIPIDVDAGLPSEVFTIGHGEIVQVACDHRGALQRLSRGMGLTRNDVVIGVGGGMVTDVAGFAAASWHRGVSVVHVATTLVGMVDAAIGGKTGVNIAAQGDAEGAAGIGGKNLIGAFWQPAGVVCDLDALATLPQREVRCGRGEMAKYHFLTGDDLLAMDEARAHRPLRRDQGGDRVERRTRRRPQGTAELRPHAGTRAGDRDRLSTGSRRGGGSGLDLRSPPGSSSGSDRRSRESSSTTTWSVGATSSTRRLPAASILNG